MIDYARDGDGIATITWNVTNRPMNVMNLETMAAFQMHMETALGDSEVKGIIINSARPEFLVGADLDMILGFAGDAAGQQPIRRFLADTHQLFRRMEKGGKPIVAAINGNAMGGGCELALSCHHRIMADLDTIRIGLPESTLGLLPGAGGTQRLPRLIGLQKALPMLLEGRTVVPKKALELGLVDQCVPQDQLLDQAKAWLHTQFTGEAIQQPWDRRGFRLPGGGVQDPKGQQTFVAGNAMLHQRIYQLYPQQRYIMSCVYEGCQVDIDTGLTIELRYITATIRTAATRNLTRFFFSEGKVRRQVKRPRDIAKQPTQKIGILGHEPALQHLAERAKKKGIAVIDLASNHTNTEFSAGDFVFITQAENHQNVDQLLAEGVYGIVLSTQDPVSYVAENPDAGARIAGVHMLTTSSPLVEVIQAKETTPATLAHTLDLMKVLGKSAIIVQNKSGFYSNRVYSAYLKEGAAMVGEGGAPALIENAGRMAGMAAGPLASIDDFSLAKLPEHTGENQTAHDVLMAMVQRGRTGAAAGKGFYRYVDGKRERLWAGLPEHFPLASMQPDITILMARLLTIQSLAALACLEEGVVEEAYEADVGAVRGWGYCAAHGGPISYIETVGVAEFVRQCDDLAAEWGDRFQPSESLRARAESGQSFFAAAA